MSLEQIKIRASDLVLGMYVSQLDRPWSSTPFPLQGLLLRHPKDIEALKSYCDYVYIDLAKGRGILDPPVDVKSVRHHEPGSKRIKVLIPAGKPNIEKQKSRYEPPPIDVNRQVYSQVIPLKVEVKHAERTLKTLRGHFLLASKQIAKGRDFDYGALRNSVDQMVDSVVRCPDAFTWLMKLRLKDQYSHDHALRSALWASQFARFVGLPKDKISILTLGTLLKDIGKTKLPSSLVRSQQRSPQQETEYRKFIELGVEMLKSRGIEPMVIAVMKHHCERNDGSGFPDGLYGGKIPLLSRIAGVASFYDQLSFPRAGKTALSPSRAISALYNMRGREFQDDLVVHFIQSVGVYPTGTLVEMTTGDIAVVVEQDPKSRLTPQLAVISPQESANDVDGYFLVDLKEPEKARKELTQRGCQRAANVPRIAIARDLEFSGHSVDLEQVAHLFMKKAANQIGGVIETGKTKGVLSRIKQKFAGL